MDKIDEEFLHYIWKFQLFNHHQLRLVSGERLELIRAGRANYDAGPDFSNTQLRVAGTLWVGNIEIHKRSSDWLLHGHHKDEAYNEIILHVVWEDDEEVNNERGELIPTLELKGLVNRRLLDNYTKLSLNENWIPCSGQVRKVDKVVLYQMLDRVLVERMKKKLETIERFLRFYNNDWEAVAYLSLAKYFGFKTNAVPFELLASSIPYSLLRKYFDREEQLNALLFGQAGLLEGNFKGNYPIHLQVEYEYLRKKHNLQPLKPSLWKFMRMRPSNFPSIRIAQLVAFLFKNKNFFQKLTEIESLKELNLLLKVKANSYWDVHYNFDVPSAKKLEKTIGKNSINILLINSVIPLLYSYGEKRADEMIKARALSFLHELKGEDNNIIRNWKKEGIQVETAFDSQALLQLKSNYCDIKNCLNCTIGNVILKRKS